MSDPVLNLSNGAYWSQVYNQQHYAEEAANTRGYYPIPAFEIPILFSSYTMAVATDSQYAQSHWWLGVRLKMIVDCPGTDFLNLEAYGVRVPVNRGMLARFPKLAPQYRLRCEIPWWHKEMRLTIWEYMGPDTDSTEDLVRASTELVRVDLIRIETRLEGSSNA